VGAGDDRPRLEQLATRLGVAADVDFLGAIDGAARDNEYAACHAFVLPSTREGFGLVFLEAMLHARPVVACDAGGAPFVVRPGAGGLLARPGDATHLAELLASLVRQPALAQGLGEQGRDFVLSEFAFPRLVQGVRCLVAARPARGGAAL
jgi:glycosyltransferase involved in cell wall biosynthesis